MQRQTPVELAVALIGAITFGAVLPASGDDKRPVPDYDGRGNPDAEAGSWLLWIPRAVLAPAYLVHEYGVRRPLGALVTHAERERWVGELHDLVTFGPDQQFMLIPTAFYDFGFSPSVGLHFTAARLGSANNALSVHAATWGRDWLAGSVRDTWRSSSDRTVLATRFEFSRRPDHLYKGIGPDVRKADSARYGLQKLEASSTLNHTAGDAQITVQAGVRRLDFRAGNGSDPALEDLVRDEMIAAPPGFDTPYTDLYQRVALAIDTRPGRPEPGTGARIALYGESNFDVTNDRRWVKYGGSLGGALDLTGHRRTLKLQVAADFVDPFHRDGMAADAVPFTELASLGGDDTMQGFGAGWMRGRSTVMTELAYTWPVWFCLDGTARFAVGNAFGDHLAGFSPDKLRMSGDLGITTNGSRDNGFEILVGLGSETFEQGGSINSFRLAFGTRRGF